MAGGEYSYVDRTARVGRTYYYQLHELEIAGTVNTYGPIEVRASWLDARWTAAVAVGIASAIGVWAVVRRRSRRAAEPKLRS
jgi:predicted secreted hydrolase